MRELHAATKFWLHSMNHSMKKLLIVYFLCPIIWMIWFHSQILLLHLFVQWEWVEGLNTRVLDRAFLTHAVLLLQDWLIFRILLIRKSKIGKSEIGQPQHSCMHVHRTPNLSPVFLSRDVGLIQAKKKGSS